jgi:hypothetical protein
MAEEDHTLLVTAISTFPGVHARNVDFSLEKGELL